MSVKLLRGRVLSSKTTFAGFVFLAGFFIAGFLVSMFARRVWQ